MTGGNEMKKEVFQVATVFIGTIVGAGLASGQEITQFFSRYGIMSFTGLLICCFLYIVVCTAVIDISREYSLGSYTEIIQKVAGGVFGKFTDLFMSFFLLSGSAIILAGSGALLKQYFNLPQYIGVSIMAVVALGVLLNDTKGLVAINSYIVPTLVTVIVVIFIIYVLFFGDSINLEGIMRAEKFAGMKFSGGWILSAFIYAGFNILCFTGVLVPFTKEMKSKRDFIQGIFIGAIVLTIISMMINLLLTVNLANIQQHNIEIPLLFIATQFRGPIQVVLLVVIWFEMFSTEVSDIYSLGKALEKKYGRRFNLSYKNFVAIILIVTIPISQIGFKTLITILYPIFGVVSLLFIIKLMIFRKNMKIPYIQKKD